MTETAANVTPPPDLTYGYVDGRIILAIGDRTDAGRTPDPVPAEGLTVTFTPANTILKVTSPTPATVIKQPIVCGVDANGYLIDGQEARGVWLVTGVYKVTYSHQRAIIPPHDIEVTTGHTEAAPLDLTTAMPPGGPVLTPSKYAELNGRLTILEAGGGGGGGSAPDATTTVKGIVRLAGDLGGTAASPTVPGLAGKAATVHTHTASQISDATSLGRANLQAPDGDTVRGNIGAAFIGHGHVISDVTGLQGALDSKGTSNLALGTTSTTAKAGDWVPAWSDVTSKPATFAPTIGSTSTTAVAGDDARLTNARTPTAHVHAGTDITSDTVPIARIPTGTTSTTVALGNHSHTPASIGAAATAHTHAISDTTGLQAALDGKSATGHTHVDLGGLTLVKCTQAAYDALGSGRPATTIYLIVG